MASVFFACSNLPYFEEIGALQVQNNFILSSVFIFFSKFIIHLFMFKQTAERSEKVLRICELQRYKVGAKNL